MCIEVVRFAFSFAYFCGAVPFQLKDSKFIFSPSVYVFRKLLLLILTLVVHCQVQSSSNVFENPNRISTFTLFLGNCLGNAWSTYEIAEALIFVLRRRKICNYFDSFLRAIDRCFRKYEFTAESLRLLRSTKILLSSSLIFSILIIVVMNSLEPFSVLRLNELAVSLHCLQLSITSCLFYTVLKVFLILFKSFHVEDFILDCQQRHAGNFFFLERVFHELLSIIGENVILSMFLLFLETTATLYVFITIVLSGGSVEFLGLSYNVTYFYYCTLLVLLPLLSFCSEHEHVVNQVSNFVVLLLSIST